jgi:hypothetical protein
MNYSTFDINNFFIKKDSTYPELKYPLIQKIREQYDISDNMLENVAVTFSMIDAETGLYRIANVPANLVIINDRLNNPDEEEYTLVYRFKLKDTKKAGRFLGEFKIDALGQECFKLTLPTNGYVNIIISDSITKTTVI